MSIFDLFNQPNAPKKKRKLKTAPKRRKGAKIQRKTMSNIRTYKGLKALPKVLTFDGKRYYRRAVSLKKSNAEYMAERIRRTGRNARVIPVRIRQQSGKLSKVKYMIMYAR